MTTVANDDESNLQSGQPRGWRRFRFRLATLLLLVAIAGIFFAWTLYYRNRVAFTGAWYYPTLGDHGTGYWETMKSRPNGTFTKFEQGRIGSEVYSGEYSVADNGVVTFHVTQKQYDPGRIPSAVETFAVDKSYRCRVAIDSHGNLIVACLAPNLDSGVRIEYPDSCDLSWHWYSPLSHEEQDQAMMERRANRRGLDPPPLPSPRTPLCFSPPCHAPRSAEHLRR